MGKIAPLSAIGCIGAKIGFFRLAQTDALSFADVAPGLPDLSSYKIPNYENIHQYDKNIPNDHKMHQMSRKYTKIIHSQAFKHKSKLVLLV
jgi:hypothetical protein